MSSRKSGSLARLLFLFVGSASAACAAADPAQAVRCPQEIEVDSTIISESPSAEDRPWKVRLPFVGMDVFVKYPDEDTLTIMAPSTSDKPKIKGLVVHWYLANSESVHLMCVYGADRLVVVHKVFKGSYDQCFLKGNSSAGKRAAQLDGYCE